MVRSLLRIVDRRPKHVSERSCKARNSGPQRPLPPTMKRFFFDLVGELSARDVLGHMCSSRKEAKDHAAFVAHRIGTERPSFAKPGNRIEVRDERGARFFAAPIKSAHRDPQL
jgi:hypothetical protein